MARGRGILLAGLAAGAYAYFKNPENRKKATIAFNNTKAKVNSFMESQNLDKNEETEENRSNPETPRENKMVAEGATASVQYYNEDEQQENEEKEEGAKLSSNDVSREKSENTEKIAPETRLNTENL